MEKTAEELVGELNILCNSYRKINKEMHLLSERKILIGEEIKLIHAKLLARKVEGDEK